MTLLLSVGSSLCPHLLPEEWASFDIMRQDIFRDSHGRMSGIYFERGEGGENYTPEFPFHSTMEEV